MRVRLLVGLGLLSVAIAGGPREASAALGCPSECRREAADVLCSTEVITDGDRSTMARYYWSS